MKISKYKKIFGVGPLGALISIALMLPFWWMDHKLGHPAISQNPIFLKTFSCLLILTGAGIHLLTIWTLRHWWVEKKVCTAGPFKVLRHPMYAAWITFIAPGISLYLNSWIFLLWSMVLHPMWHLIIRQEESIIIEIFGDEYRKYASRTGRVIPRFF